MTRGLQPRTDPTLQHTLEYGMGIKPTAPTLRMSVALLVHARTDLGGIGGSRTLIAWVQTRNSPLELRSHGGGRRSRTGTCCASNSRADYLHQTSL